MSNEDMHGFKTSGQPPGTTKALTPWKINFKPPTSLGFLANHGPPGKETPKGHVSFASWQFPLGLSHARLAQRARRGSVPWLRISQSPAAQRRAAPSSTGGQRTTGTRTQLWLESAGTVVTGQLWIASSLVYELLFNGLIHVWDEPLGC